MYWFTTSLFGLINIFCFGISLAENSLKESALGLKWKISFRSVLRRLGSIDS